MVNKEVFINRLEELMQHYEISAAGLADKIGVQRSSISHLLAGRNKPSLDFIIKILDNYPQISFDWLVKGHGTSISDDIDLAGRSSSPTLFDDPDVENTKEISEKTTSKLDNLGEKHKKKLVKIVLLYADGSFDTYDKTAE